MPLRHIALACGLLVLSACSMSVSRSSVSCGSTSGPPEAFLDVTGLQGQSVRTTLKPSFPSFCESSSPNRAVVKIRDPNGDSVQSETEFIAGPEHEPAAARVIATFTPALPGWYELTAEFEPNFGRTFGEVFIFAPSTEKGSLNPVASNSPKSCATLEETTSGILLCDGAVVSNGGGAALSERTRVVGNTVWALSASMLTRYDAASGTLLSSATAQSSTNNFLELLHVTETEAWVSEKDTGSKRFTWTAQDGLVESAKLAKGPFDARRLFVHGDVLTVLGGGDPGEQPLGADSEPSSEFSVCEHSLSQLGTPGNCAKAIGHLIGATSSEVYSYSATERLLRVLVFEEGHLIPKNSVRVPVGWLSLPQVQSGRNALVRTATFTEGPGGIRPYLAIPRRTAEGLVLERFDSAGIVPAAANERFIWGTDGTRAQLRVLRRAP